jgi:hypothetical protein
VSPSGDLQLDAAQVREALPISLANPGIPTRKYSDPLDSIHE